MGGQTTTRALLYLDGQEAGEVTVQRREGAWRFGQFKPGQGFTSFEPLYTAWSRLLHADDGHGRLSRSAADELRQLEYRLYRIDARVFLPDISEWRKIALLNIDGPLIDWKEQGSEDCPPKGIEKGITV